MSDLTVAVVGASRDRRKFGNKSVRAHDACGWTVYPVHPTETSIEGLPAFASLADLPTPVRRVSLYLPAAVGATLAAELAALAADEVYVNPGAEGPELRAALAAHDVQNVRYACSIVDLGVRPSDFPG